MLNNQNVSINSQLDKLERISNQISLLISNNDFEKIKENLEWEKIRYLSHMIYNTNVTKKSHLIEPKKLFPLPQDKMYKKEVVVPTKQDLENFEKQINKITKKTILKI